MRVKASDPSYPIIDTQYRAPSLLSSLFSRFLPLPIKLLFVSLFLWILRNVVLPIFIFNNKMYRNRFVKSSSLLSSVQGHKGPRLHMSIYYTQHNKPRPSWHLLNWRVYLDNPIWKFKVGVLLKKKLLEFECVTFQMSLSHLILAFLSGEPQHLCQ